MLQNLKIEIFKTFSSYSGAVLWNNLPMFVSNVQSVGTDKEKLNAHLLSQ
jgi:hypothetical protein